MGTGRSDGAVPALTLRDGRDAHTPSSRPYVMQKPSAVIVTNEPTRKIATTATKRISVARRASVSACTTGEQRELVELAARELDRVGLEPLDAGRPRAPARRAHRRSMRPRSAQRRLMPSEDSPRSREALVAVALLSCPWRRYLRAVRSGASSTTRIRPTRSCGRTRRLYRGPTHKFWTLSRFADIKAALADYQLFSSDILQRRYRHHARRSGRRRSSRARARAAAGNLIVMDPPQHTAYRKSSPSASCKRTWRRSS